MILNNRLRQMKIYVRYRTALICQAVLCLWDRNSTKLSLIVTSNNIRLIIAFNSRTGLIAFERVFGGLVPLTKTGINYCRVRTLPYTSHIPLAAIHAHDRGCHRRLHFLSYINRMHYNWSRCGQ